MKKTFLIFSFISLCWTYAYTQNIHTVNPTPGSVADFPSFSEAVEAASSGDILLLHGGNYGVQELNKTIVIYGTGYFLSGNKKTQSKKVTTRFEKLTINAGAENSIISGIEIYENLQVFASNILIKGNRILPDGHGTAINMSGCSSINVIGNYVGNSIHLVSGTILKNNFIGGGLGGDADSNGTNPVDNVLIENNIIIGAPTSHFNTVSIASFANNYVSTVSGAGNSSPTNNIFAENGDIGTSNQFNVPIESVFIGSNQTSSDTQWQLKEGSPAIEAGVGGTDVGMFGGDSPYELSGIPSIPNIYELKVGEVGTSKGGLEVQIKVKANN
ncbi:MAG: hypothetical protein ABJF04_09215 [Reichenbachiella sp.]|uniref:hypothetical protein n=1 Tax=Reichenbachiella sp. TaxID=2184521 RepID=UPI0032676D2B